MFQDATSLIPQLVQSLGPAGASFGIMLWVMLRQNKKYEQRITDLENTQGERYEETIKVQAKSIDDYVMLVRTTTQVLADLTNCLKAIKETLDSIDRKNT